MFCLELFILVFLNWVIRMVILLAVTLLKRVWQTFESLIKYIMGVLIKIKTELIHW